MSTVPRHPLDYDLDDEVHADTPAALKALGSPVRSQILDLVLERAVSVNELAASLDRPRSSIAHHVDALVDAGLLRVVRTRKVRAIDERFYGRTGRTIVVGGSAPPGPGDPVNVKSSFLRQANDEAHGSPEVRATLRHARIPAERADEFFDRVARLAEEFTGLERGGDTVYGFVGAVYATDHPVLQPAVDEEPGR